MGRGRGFLRRIVVASCLCAAPGVSALAPAPPRPPRTPEAPRDSVSTRQVTRSQTAQAKKLVRQCRDSTQREPGNLRSEALQRIGSPYHAVLPESWKHQASAESHGKTPTTTEF